MSEVESDARGGMAGDGFAVLEVRRSTGRSKHYPLFLAPETKQQGDTYKRLAPIGHT